MIFGLTFLIKWGKNKIMKFSIFQDKKNSREDSGSAKQAKKWWKGVIFLLVFLLAFSFVYPTPWNKSADWINYRMRLCLCRSLKKGCVKIPACAGSGKCRVEI
ncbi:MAG TPA: hypothetical protein ENL06_02940, partial [Candidatus Portnoybacteria bacterium]|nr:hypothetical protein [Candidatus Portnoybacteria bacterium]